MPLSSTTAPADVNLLDLWRTLLRDVALVEQHLTRALGEVSLADYVVLAAVREPARLSALADRLGWEQSRVSHHVARLVDRGLAERVPCANDRRGCYVAATPAGQRVHADARPRLRGALDAIHQPLSPTQLRSLARAVASLDAALAPLPAARSRTRC